VVRQQIITYFSRETPYNESIPQGDNPRLSGKPAAGKEVQLAMKSKIGLGTAILFLAACLCFVHPQTIRALTSDAAPVKEQAPALTISAGETAAAASPSGPSALDGTVRIYLSVLSSQPGFEAWKQASWECHPLGPGTHGWIVLLHQGGREIGYLVVYAAKDGSYQLGEYGTGSHPLFSLAALYQTLIQLELIADTTTYSEFAQDSFLNKQRLYPDPLHAVWRLAIGGETVYIDAKTGERLPLLDRDIPSAAEADPTNAAASDRITDAWQRTPFDPYLNISWLAGEPLKPSAFPLLLQTLKRPEGVIFAANLFQGRVIKPLAVTGYQSWERRGLFLRVEDDGSRYLPWRVLASGGQFYPMLFPPLK